MEFTLGQLAETVGATVRGDAGCLINSVGTLRGAVAGQITFLANRRYRRYLSTTQASAVILRQEDAGSCPVNALVVANPYLAYARIAALLNPPPQVLPGIHKTVVIGHGCNLHPTVSIAPYVSIGNGVSLGEGVVIGPGCVVGDNVVIGAASRLVANVTLCHGSRLGERVLVHPGVVIGSDGFGMANDNGRWIKVPQLGAVVIGNDVEIGANTTIDRGALGDTVIEEGVKLDNQIQIAHNVYIGAHTVVAGCVGIAGSARIGSRCQLAGGVGIVGHIEITDDVHITGMSMVTSNIDKPGIYSSGTPLQPNRRWHRNAARFGQLDDMARRLRRLEKGEAADEDNDANEYGQSD